MQEEKDLPLKRFYDNICEKYMNDISYGDSELFRTSYTQFVDGLLSVAEDRSRLIQYLSDKCSDIKERYDSQPVHFTQEFSVFRFMKDGIDDVVSFSLYKNREFQEVYNYWVLFFVCIECLVTSVESCDEAQINRFQRIFDRICSSCPYLRA